MYRSDVRLLTFDKGIEILKQEFEKSKNEYYINVLKNISINNSTDDIIYLGWERLNNECIRFLKDALFKLEEEKVTYKIAIMGQDFEDVNTYEYVAPEDENKNIPTLYINRTFNENEIETFLKNYEKEIDTIEY